MRLERLVARGQRLRPLLISIIAFVLGLTALLGLGWSGSPFRLHAPAAAVWATVGGTLAIADICRAPRDSERRFFAAVALCVSAIALVESLLVLVAFTPCGGRCV
jgi:hypothetical protein